MVRHFLWDVLYYIQEVLYCTSTSGVELTFDPILEQHEGSDNDFSDWRPEMAIRKLCTLTVKKAT